MYSGSPSDLTPAVYKSPANIRFLTFQGGGGKGVAYLGAWDWLEHNKAPLPLYQKPGIKGLSGTSAGAITAFLVALGFSAQQAKGYYREAGLDTLVDDPALGQMRCVTRDQSVVKFDNTSVTATISNILGLLSLSVFSTLATTVAKLDPKSVAYHLLVTPGYFTCLFFDGGMISGIRLRQWLGSLIIKSDLYTSASAATKQQIPNDGTKITFSQLYQLGGSTVQFAVVATNITTGRPMVFSSTSTPNFPVADAVAMSASLPGVFKPVWIGENAPLSDQSGKNGINVQSYVGWYIDGGITNNLPIHLFDNYPSPVPYDPYLNQTAPGQAPLVTLNGSVLGLRLAPGNIPSTTSLQQYQNDPDDTQSLPPVLQQTFNALMFGANMGQLRSSVEGLQTALIYCGDAGTLDFVATDDVITNAWNNGVASIKAYYRQ